MAFLVKAVAFFRSPQGKRDLALITAAAGAVVDVLKQFGLI